jgi:hypothetical protein
VRGRPETPGPEAGFDCIGKMLFGRRLRHYRPLRSRCGPGAIQGVIVIENVASELVSIPPVEVPPSSWARTVTVAEPV